MSPDILKEEISE